MLEMPYYSVDEGGNFSPKSRPHPR